MRRCLLSLLLCATAQAEPAYQVVGDGIPQPLTATPGDAARGRAIVASRQTGLCLLCHGAPIAEERFRGNLATDLAGAGSRWSEAQLQLRLVDSRRLNPTSPMPAYYRADGLQRVGETWQGRTILTAQQIEDVVGDMKRRGALAMAASVVLLPPARATPEALAAAIRSFSGGTPLREGKVRLDVARLVDNGNTVPVSVSAPGAAPAEVAAIALFNERNPQSDVARFHFGPRAGERIVSTRIRLATSQQLVAVARLADGSCWMQRVEVVVTLAACIE